jgi:hypothetical protein
MGHKVFANGREISGKAATNKTICAMPDVCLSPPAPPAGPVPIPYPNTALASQCHGGSKTVRLGGKQASLKNASTYKKSNGDEPATRSFGANVITHNLQGPMRFAAWSFDVTIEGKNAPRFMDLTTHNHANAGGGAVGANMGEAGVPAVIPPDDCKAMKDKNDNDRANMATPGSGVEEIASGQKPNAIARASVGGQSGSMVGASRHRVLSPHVNGLQRGLVTKKYPATSSRVCPGDPFTFPRTVPPAQYHAEPRLLESVPAGGRPSVTLAIDWRDKSSPPTKRVPCKHCEKLIQHACKCMDIYVCSDKHKPVSQCPKK